LDPMASEAPSSAGEPTLYDLIMIERHATIFGDYVRTVKDITTRLGDREMATTVLVPTNKAVIALARKPHQGPPPETDSGRNEIEINEKEIDEEANKHVRDWVSAHIISRHPIDLSSEEEYPTLHAGTSIRFTESKTPVPDREHYVLYPDVKIISKIEAANGVIYIIEGTVSYYD